MASKNSSSKQKRVRLRPYEVTYKGLFTGGLAIVLAIDEDHAQRLVEKHTTTHRFTEVEVYELPVDAAGCVLYNWNGDVNLRIVEEEADENQEERKNNEE